MTVKVGLSIYVIEFPRRGMDRLTETWKVSSIEEIAQFIGPSQICLQLFRKLWVSGAVKPPVPQSHYGFWQV